MKQATAVEHELTKQFLEILTAKYLIEIKDLKIWDTFKIKDFKRLLEKHGSKIFSYEKAICHDG